MRRLLAMSGVLVALTAAPACAADLAHRYAPETPPLPAPTWTGFYVGANGGYGWQDPTVTLSPNDIAASRAIGVFAGGTPPPGVSFGTDGGLGGLQAGYSWQFDRQWVVGMEADFDWSDIRGSGTSNFFLNGPASNFEVDRKVAWFGTVRGRVGWLPRQDVLLYGTGGLAYGRVDESASLNTSPTNAFATNGFRFVCNGDTRCFNGSSARTLTGWTVGAGVEYRLWRNLSIKAEYLYVNLGHGNRVDTSAVSVAGLAPGTLPASYTAAYRSADFNLVRAGLNWKF